MLSREETGNLSFGVAGELQLNQESCCLLIPSEILAQCKWGGCSTRVGPVGAATAAPLPQPCVPEAQLCASPCCLHSKSAQGAHLSKT